MSNARVRDAGRERLRELNATVHALDCERLEELGDALAKREGDFRIDGLEAAWLYVCEKYHWTPTVVRAMSPGDLVFLLNRERVGGGAGEEAARSRARSRRGRP